ncbi:LysR family transcriptional regulator [Cumulibacter manganitolerans]|uniref:LysR family transcriptional regulator n=1 Tax=Cumulibacter manganitolerans TaxID=1884992 RepID=UPI00129680F4|nr:LysR substrate-binding domain-containing protein [Cumulibacter manganitolerans]
MLDVHRLRLLRELRLRGTISAVAQALSYTPSAVSQQLAVLEREAGVPLLERVGRRVRLTRQGEVLVGHADIIMDQLDEAEADLARSRDEVSGRVRIAMFQSALHALLPDALEALQTAHPKLRVEVEEREPSIGAEMLLTHDVDLALREEYPGEPLPTPPGLSFQELCRDGMSVAVPPHLAGRVREAWSGRTTIRDLALLADQPWILDPKPESPRTWVENLCLRAGFMPDTRYESVDVLSQLRMVESGHAVAVVPDLMWLVHQPKAALFPIPGKPLRRRVVTAVRRGSAGHPAIRAVREALRASVPAELRAE